MNLLGEVKNILLNKLDKGENSYEKSRVTKNNK